jgi:histidinol-phosphate aminotransferase
MRPQLSAIAATLSETIPFTAPEEIERRTGVPIRGRLGANESGFGPSPRVVAAMADAAPQMWRYCDPTNYELRKAIAKHLGVEAENVIVGEGADGLQRTAIQLLFSPGDIGVTSHGTYPGLYHAMLCGGGIETVPYEGLRESIEGLLEAAHRLRPKAVYVCNPDNPIGTCWSAEETQRFIREFPSDTMLLLDEAYCELAPSGVIAPLDTTQPNVLRFRTFSKAYGLAGLRVGYAIGEASIIRAFDRARLHFGVNRMAQTAALAALGDQDWVREVVARNVRARERIYDIAQANGLASVPSATNFVAIDCGRDGAYALRVLRALEQRGVFTRKPGVPPLDRFIRVSTGPDDELDVFAEELPRALRDAT